MARLSRIFVFTVACVLAAACSSEEPPSREAQAPAQEAQPSAQELRLSSLSESFDRIKSYAEHNPRELHHILNQIDNFKTEAAGTEFGKKADNLAAAARRRFNDEAKLTCEKICEEAEKLSAEGKPREALAVLGEYPAEFSSTEWQKRIDETTEPIEREARADQRLATLREEVKVELEKHNPEAALKLVNKYPEYMRRDKRRGEEWQKLHADLSAKVEAIRERRRKEEALSWDELFTGEDMAKWSPQTGEWELRDGCIVGKYQGANVGQLSCGTESTSWDDFIIELDFKIVSGDFLVLGVRGKNIGEGRSVFDQIDLTSDNFPRGKFHYVTIEVRGESFAIRERGTDTIYTKEADPDHTKGFICFFILDGAEVHIRKMRIKLLK